MQSHSTNHLNAACPNPVVKSKPDMAGIWQAAPMDQWSEDMMKADLLRKVTGSIPRAPLGFENNCA